MKFRTVLTHSGKALIYLIVVVCCACICEKRMRAAKRKVAAILHVDKGHKDQAGYINVQQENPWDKKVR